MIDPTRLARAIYLTAKPIDVSTYRVRGGIADHMVEIVDGRCYCDCADAEVRGPGCKHCLLVRLLGGDPDVVKALRLLVPYPDRRRTPRPDPASPESSATGPDSRRTAPYVGPGATNADDREGQPR